MSVQVQFDNAAYLIIQHFSSPMGARLKELYSTWSPFLPWLSRRAKSGRRNSFGRQCGSPNHI